MKPFAIANPCSQDWGAMRRDSTSPARHCASCDKRVYDLASMSEPAIRGLAILTGGHFCARQTTVDGQLVVAPPPAAPRRAPFMWRMVTGGMIVAGALATAACEPAAHAGAPTPIQVEPGPTPAPAPTPDQPPAPPVTDLPDEPLMGEIAIMPPAVDRDVLFPRGRFNLTPEGKRILDDIAAAMKADPSIVAVGIVGHITPDEVTERHGSTLAFARATVTRDYLVKHGVDASRLRPGSNGATRPLVPNDSEAHRAQNRRVELRICPDAGHCP
ncbi:MAG: OmpA family protein [Myxococcota bacterium]